jgi:hypothetical protein
MLAAAAASIWLLFLFMRRVAGQRAAVAACLLLATDPIYVLTSCFDWGPVALQHLLAMGGLVLTLRFWRTRREWALAAALFLFGLMLWDKALAIWSLTGFALAALCTQARGIAVVVTPRRIAVGCAGFALGAFPLIAYNVQLSGVTIQQTVAYDFGSISQKLRVLETTADGSGMFGWLNADDSDGRIAHLPHGTLQIASEALAASTGRPRHDWMLWAFAAALLLAPMARGAELRIIIFALSAMVCTWGLMAITANAGTALHHTILLWPLPQMVIGASFAAASRHLSRADAPALAAAVLLLAGSNLAVLNNYYAAMVRNGGAVNWSDAIFALSGSLKNAPRQEFYCVDWGIMASLHLLNRGQLPLLVGSEQLSHPEWSQQDRDQLRAMVSDPGHIFLTHAPGFEFFKGYTARLVSFANSAGFRRETLSVIPDTHGRPTFEVYRFVPAT